MHYGEMNMTGTGPAMMPPPPPPTPLPANMTIASRFGAITVSPAAAIFFPNGLLGIPQRGLFCLAEFPSEKMRRFSILQSIEDHALAFITLPIDPVNPLIAQADIAQAAADLSIAMDDLLVLLVVSVKRENNVAKVTVNARAPIMVRVSQRQATQYVFPHTKYEIRQPIAL